MLARSREDITASHGPHKPVFVGWGHRPISERVHKVTELQTALGFYAEYEGEIRRMRALPKTRVLDPDCEYYRARDRRDRAAANDMEMREIRTSRDPGMQETAWRGI